MSTVPSNAFQTYDLIGDREDLADVIYNISPTDTPFMSMIAGRGRARAVLHEWQTDELDTAASNAAVEGDDAATLAATPTVRLTNRTQISTKTARVSGTADAIDKAGRQNELAYQMMKRSEELKRDMEFVLTQNQPSADGDGATIPRNLGGLETWYQTNENRGVGGSSGGWSGGDTSAATDGTQRPLTEAMVREVIREIWTEGGVGEVIMCGPFNKQAISLFDGSGTIQRRENAETSTLSTAIDYYRSDFGRHMMVANRFSRDRTVHLLTKRYWKVCYLRSFRSWPIAKTGDSEARQILCEYTLQAGQEKASGVVADLNDS